METINSDEKRECVRAPLGVDVHYQVLSEDQYEKRRAGGETATCRGCRVQRERWAPDGAEDKAKPGGVDPYVVDFLIHLEEKMDHMLTLLSKYEEGGERLLLGHGLNISGRGMRIRCEQPVETGLILDVRARMFRFPVVILRLFGKVLRVKEVKAEGESSYELALEFLDLDKDAEEWIISYVFQKQREAIRSSKG
jgi:hypothetical protein